MGKKCRRAFLALLCALAMVVSMVSVETLMTAAASEEPDFSLDSGRAATDENGVFTSRIGYQLTLPKDYYETCEIQSYSWGDVFVLKEADDDAHTGALLKIVPIMTSLTDMENAYGKQEQVLYEGEEYRLVAFSDDEEAYDYNNAKLADQWKKDKTQLIDSLSSFKILDSFYKDSSGEYDLEYKDYTDSFEATDETGNPLMSVSLSRLRLINPDRRAELQYVNEYLEAAYQTEKQAFQKKFDDSYKKLILEKRAEGNEDYKGSYQLKATVGWSKRNVFSYLAVRTVKLGGKQEEITYEGHTYSSAAYEYGLQDVIRDQDRFDQALRKQLKKSAQFKKISAKKKWKNYIYKLAYGSANYVPVWYLGTSDMQIIFTGKSAQALGLSGKESVKLKLSYKKYLPVFNQFIIKPGKPKQVTVSSTKQLMNAIACNTTITLKPGTYNLTKYRNSSGMVRKVDGQYKVRAAWEEKHPDLLYDYDGFTINHVYGLTLQASKPGTVKIVTEEPAETVLSYIECNDVTLKNITLGHEIEPGHCSGNVLGFSSTYVINLTGVDLYGCGAYGIRLGSSGALTAKDTNIHDCTYGILTAYNAFDCNFKDCSFNDNKEYTLLDVYESDRIYFKDCSFKNNTGDLYPTDVATGITFEDCTFTDPESDFISQHMGNITYMEDGAFG